MSDIFSYPVKVSVLIPTYNAEKYIAEAIESVLKQSFADFECLIADDGSTDKTIDIIKKYAKKDKRIHFYKNEKNLGCSKNINTLLLHAQGKYLKILIQDDVISTNYLQEAIKILDTHPNVTLVTSYQKFIGEDEKVREYPEIPVKAEVKGKEAQRLLIERGNWIGGETATIFRHENLSMGLWNTEWDWQVDQDIWIRMLSIGDLYVIPTILSYPRVHSGQATVYLNKDFRFVREELMQLKTAFMYPEVYGSFTSDEKKNLYKKTLLRLIDQGLHGWDISKIRKMMSIGRDYNSNLFYSLLIKMVFFKLVKGTRN